MRPDVKQNALKRLNYIGGHLSGIRRMVESETYCVDVLKQTHAVRKAIEKLEALMLDGHLRSCVAEGIGKGQDTQIVNELVDLYKATNR